MAKNRRDSKGRSLQKGETYNSGRKLYCFNYRDPLGHRRYIYSKSLIKLREKEREIRRDSLDGIDSYARSNCTLDFLFARYIGVKQNLRNSTRTNYIYTYRRYIKDTLGKRKIGDIKYSELLYFYQKQLDRGLSLNTVDSMHRVVSAALKLAVRDDIIRKNPADGVMAELKASNKKSEARHPLSYKQEKAFLNCLDQPENKRWKPIFYFMFGTGCRVGEVIGIRWEDIDFEAGEISINHDTVYCPREDDDFRCGFEINMPKTDAGIRTIPLLDKVRDVLLEEKDYLDKNGLYRSLVVDGMTDFVFYNRFGTLHKPSALNKIIKRIVDDHNEQETVKAAEEDREPLLIPYFSCHIIRHTFCTRLCENETNIKLIQQIMGHVDIRTTMDIYAEVTKEKAHSVFKELNNGDVL